MRIRPWFLAALMVAFCASAFLVLDWQRRSRDFSDAALLMRLPEGEGTCLYVNVQALRQSGMLDVLAGQRTEEEPDYQAFVRATGFDYRDDLDAVMVQFGIDSSMYIVRGRFSWQQISRYLKSFEAEAKCSNGVCSIPVSRGRYLSAMPLAENLVAIGVGPNRTVVYSALTLRERKNTNLPKAPFWMELSEEFLRNPRRLPEGTRAFVGAVRGAHDVFVSVVPANGGLEARLQAAFPTPADASAARANLAETTATLRKFFTLDKQQPSQSPIATMLLAGAFDQKESQVTGRWPLPASLFTSLLANQQ
jgi:hypothetical protein